MKSLLRVALAGAALSIATASALAGGYAVVELPVKSTWKKGSIASNPIAIDRHGVTAFRYDTALHPLQGLPGGLSAAVAINDSGTAVGHSRTAHGWQRAVQWNADGNVSLVGSDLLELPNCLSRATAITPSGVVYGISTFTWITFPYHRAVRFEGDHEVDLGALMAPGGSPTDNESSVLAVNTKGQAVGWSTNMPKDRTQQAVIFDGAANVTELNSAKENGLQRAVLSC